MDKKVTTADHLVYQRQGNYFEFIDGLRAIAVLSVLLYHYGRLMHPRADLIGRGAVVEPA